MKRKFETEVIPTVIDSKDFLAVYPLLFFRHQRIHSSPLNKESVDLRVRKKAIFIHGLETRQLTY